MNIEREIKLRLTPQALPALARLATARHSVASIYYDTPDEALRRAGAALRLRREGRRWLQTLKAQGDPHAGLAARAEWELPVRGNGLELAAFPQDEIRGVTGLDLVRLARRVRPVFETRFTRRSGLIALPRQATAELAIDRGRIVANGRTEPIGEVELELVSGDPAALLAFAEDLALPLAYESKAERGYRLASGLRRGPRKWQMPAIDPAGTPGAAFAAIFAAALSQAGTNAAGMLSSPDPEYLHQLRVALRRLRTALRTFAPILRDERSVVRPLRRLTPALGTARDLDVFVQTLSEAGARPSVLREARGRRALARRAALEVVSSEASRSFYFTALRWLHSEPWKDDSRALAAFATERLQRLWRKAQADFDAEHPRRRHRFRVRIKRLRYASEFFAPCFPGREAYTRQLEALQEVLGELNDIAVARRICKDMKTTLPARLEARERRPIARLYAAWERLRRAGTLPL